MTARTAAVASAASAAFPPFIKIEIPVDDASGCEEATHPLVHTMGERRELNGMGKGSDSSDAREEEDGPVTDELCQSAIVLLLCMLQDYLMQEMYI